MLSEEGDFPWQAGRLYSEAVGTCRTLGGGSFHSVGFHSVNSLPSHIQQPGAVG